MTKRCPDCGEEKAQDGYGKNATQADGLSFYCLDCNRHRARQHYRKKRAAAGFSVREPDRSPEGYKRCSGCRAQLPLAQFHAHKTQRDGLNAYCKSCRSQQNRAAHLKHSYGLGTDELRVMIEQQRGVCAICKRRDPVQVDHDHLFGSVRGVLCFPCNVALGHLQDDIELFQNAIDYLERTTWQRTLVSTGVYQLISPRRAAAASSSSSERLRRIFSPVG
jgi:hypothetical protein